MKKRVGLLLGIVFISLLFSTYVLETGNRQISFTLNGKEYKEPAAAMANDQVMVPLSFLKRTFNRDVVWAEVQQIPSKQGHFSDGVAVLMYHHIMEEPTQDDIISAAQFDEQMGLLKRNGFNVIGLEQYMAFMLHGDPVPVNAVLITFDDGYESFYKLAFPILKKYGYAAVSFVIVSKIDNPSQPGIPKLHWDQMREMKKSGIEFMNHTYNLHRFGVIDAKGKESYLTMEKIYLEKEGRQETIAEYEQRLRADISLGETILRKELGNTYGVIAFPYGLYNQHLLSVIKELGIELSFTIKPGINSNRNQIAYRINAGRSDIEPEWLIKQLKVEGKSYKQISDRQRNLAITIDGKPITFSKVMEGKEGLEPLVSLREFCQYYNVGIEWNKSKRLVSLTT